MALLCLDCFKKINEIEWASLEVAPSVPKLEDGVCPVCHGTESLDVNNWELWTGTG